jgi:hypothetical protein
MALLALDAATSFFSSRVITDFAAHVENTPTRSQLNIG